MTTDKKMRALELLEQENAALQAQLQIAREQLAALVSVLIEDAAGRDNGRDNTGIPFFSESFLYDLLGKEDARTVLGSLDRLASALNVQPNKASCYRDLSRARERLSMAFYGFDESVRKLPSKCLPELDESTMPAAVKLGRKSRTPKQQKEVEAWYESEPYKKFTKEMNEYREDVPTQVVEKFGGLYRLNEKCREAEGAVRDAEAEAFMQIRMGDEDGH